MRGKVPEIMSKTIKTLKYTAKKTKEKRRKYKKNTLNKQNVPRCCHSETKKNVSNQKKEKEKKLLFVQCEYDTSRLVAKPVHRARETNSTTK